jgi:hypothetical protein
VEVAALVIPVPWATRSAGAPWSVVAGSTGAAGTVVAGTVVAGSARTARTVATGSAGSGATWTTGATWAARSVASARLLGCGSPVANRGRRAVGAAGTGSGAGRTCSHT